MPSTSENGVFISWPGAGIRPAPASNRSRPLPVIASKTQPCSVSSAFQA